MVPVADDPRDVYLAELRPGLEDHRRCRMISVQPAIRSVWRLNLRHGVARQVEHAPDGGHVVLVAPPGRYPDNSEIAWICDHARHLGSITVESTSTAVAVAWETALRYGLHVREQPTS